MRIDACYDSHVHWPATGEFNQRLNLRGLKSADDVKSLKISPAHFRGEWLLGFGWDDNAWPDRPKQELLDTLAPGRPVAFSRADGHAYWCNSEALKRIRGDEIPAGGRREGAVLIDQAMEAITRLIPKPSAGEMRRHLLEGVKRFNDAGYTHIRDMTCDEQQWNESVRIDQTGLLTLAVEEYFWLKQPNDLDAILTLVGRARAENSPNLRAQGVKIFLDGALGSEGAWLSRCYCGRDHSGLRLWEDAALSEVLRKTWEKGFHVACHAIGDEAVDRLVRIASEIENPGELHIEHGELIRPATVEMMRARITAGQKIEVHMQPAHWLDDRAWLEKKVGDLAQNAFPWRKLQEAEIPFDFGSDAPIAPTSVTRIFQALRLSSDAGIPRLLGLPNRYLGHRDLSWAPNSFSLFDEEVPAQVVFRGEHLS